MNSNGHWKKNGDYYKELYDKIFDKLDETDKIFESHNLPKQRETWGRRGEERRRRKELESMLATERYFKSKASY